MATINVEDLIKAGVHFGHRTSRWNPKMAPYIFKKRNLIHIIDLKQTVRGLLTARRVAKAIAKKGEYVLFAGTKRQARLVIRREAQRCGMPYVAERWPGGLLTNYTTIRQRLERLQELEELERTGTIELHSKKMISSLRRERRKIERNLGGVREMNRLPGLLVIVDPGREEIAVREAVKLEIPAVAWVDTDGDPEPLDVVVPANDDAIGSIEIFCHMMAEAVLEGLQKSRVSEPASAEAVQAGLVPQSKESAPEKGGGEAEPAGAEETNKPEEDELSREAPSEPEEETSHS